MAGFTGSNPDDIRLTRVNDRWMMGHIDQVYAARYRLPHCVACGKDSLSYNSYKVYEVQLFCANEQCPDFVKTFWVKKTDLEER